MTGPFMRCPECGKRGVSMRLRTGGEDHWGCRYCGWAAFADGYDAMDVEGRAALREANPEHPAAPLPEPDRYRSSRTI